MDTAGTPSFPRIRIFLTFFGCANVANSTLSYGVGCGNMDLFENTPNAPREVTSERACRWCNTHLWRLEPGKGPHAARLRCPSCGFFVWITKEEREQYDKA